jgi:hypothetical protein
VNIFSLRKIKDCGELRNRCERIKIDMTKVEDEGSGARLVCLRYQQVSGERVTFSCECSGEGCPLDPRRSTDPDGLPWATACAWHGAHYVGEVCPGRPADDEPLPDVTGSPPLCACGPMQATTLSGRCYGCGRPTSRSVLR